jgi:hypothetical protein
MIILGYILLWVGFIICVVGEAKFLVVAYRRSLLWFFGCLFIPVAGLAFFLLNFRKTWRPALLSNLGFLMMVIGCWAGGFDLFR